MYELSLFSGAGGGLLATKWMLGWRTIGYVEWGDYCQKVIAQRIKDGLLDEAPIFGDIRSFINEGYAERYQGMVDVITAGFPCQPFSVAGKQKGADDERNMWPATAQVISIVRPQSVLLENVPGIRRYLPVVVRDLRRIGYEVRRPLILGADDVGAPHRRKRVWIMAVAIGAGTRDNAREIETNRRRGIRGDESALRQAYGKDGTDRIEPTGSIEADVADTLPEYGKEFITRDQLSETRRQEPLRGESLGTRGWWATEPRLGRVAHGVAHRVDRLKAIGNGQVPAVVARVWDILNAQ